MNNIMKNQVFYESPQALAVELSENLPILTGSIWEDGSMPDQFNELMEGIL